MVKIKIDNQEFEVQKGEYVIDIALKNGIAIPHYCYHPALSRPANCRICLVEVEKAPKPMPSCILQAQDGMVVYTNSPKVMQARRLVMEYMLLNHPVDCPVCDKAGECKLQDFYFEYNAMIRRAPKERVKKKKVVDIGPEIILDSERCILCTRCIRFMDEIAKSPSLGIIEKGAYSELTVFEGKPLDNPYSLNTVDLCPVGALTSKDFRFKQRVWFLTTSPSICSLCATGCNTIVHHKNNKIYRIVPQYNEKVNGYFMCNYGRLMYKKIQNDTLTYSIINNKPVHNKLEVLNFLNSLKNSSHILFIIGQNMTMEELLGVFILIRKNYPHCYIYYEISSAGFLDSNYSDNYLIDKDKNPNTAGLRLIVDNLPTDILFSKDSAGKLQDLRIDSILILDEFFYLRAQRQSTISNSNTDGTFISSSIENLLKNSGNKVIYFTSLKNPAISKFYNVICTPNIFSKSGSFINRNNICQRFEKVFHDSNSVNLLELYNILGLNVLSCEKVWEMASEYLPQIKGINFSTQSQLNYETIKISV